MNKKQVDKGPVDILWDVFSSVRLSVIVLTLLAVTSIIGTLIPQNGSAAMYIQNYGEAAYRVLLFLDIFDMYHSWWFQLLMALLGLNLVICSMDRFPKALKIVGKAQKMTPGAYRQGAKGAPLKVPGSPDAVVAELSNRLKSPMGTFTVVEEGAARFLYAEKGRWTRMGVYVVHASVLLLLGGGLLGSLLGYEGTLNIPEGESASEVTLRGTDVKLPLGFTVRCDDFDVSFYDTGAPNEYRSDLVVSEGGQEVLSKRIVVNDPLRYKGISLYQSNYGTVAPKSIPLIFVSKASGMQYPVTGLFGEPLTIPEGLGEFTPMHFVNNYKFRGHAVGETVLGLLKKKGGDPLQLALPIKYGGFDRMRGGDVAIFTGDFQKRYYTGLQVTKDPGVWFVYAGFILLIAGCYITFFMSHQGYMVEVTPRKKGSSVILYGSANKNKLGMEMAIRRLTEKLEKETQTLEGQVKK